MKLKSLGKKNTGRFSEDFAEEKKKDKKPKEVKPKKVVKKEKKKVNTEEERWDSIDTGGDD